MKIEKVSFEELSNETLYQILKLRVDVFVVEQNCPYPEIDNRDQNAKHFYIQEEGRIIAYLRSFNETISQMVIGRIITHIDHRKNGLAKKMIEEAINSADKKTEIVFLQGQIHLQDYYETFGFKKMSDPYDYDGIMHIDMELTIKH